MKYSCKSTLETKELIISNSRWRWWGRGEGGEVGKLNTSHPARWFYRIVFYHLNNFNYIAFLDVLTTLTLVISFSSLDIPKCRTQHPPTHSSSSCLPSTSTSGAPSHWSSNENSHAASPETLWASIITPGLPAKVDLKMWKDFSRNDRLLYMESWMLLGSLIRNSLGTLLWKWVLQYFGKRYSWHRCWRIYKLRKKCDDRYHGVDQGTYDSTVGETGCVRQGPRRIRPAHSQGYLSSLMTGVFTMVS